VDVVVRLRRNTQARIATNLVRVASRLARASGDRLRCAR